MFDETTHRPWPLPDAPWALSQCWHHLLFAHWPLPPAVLHPLIPDGLELDTFDGQGWLGIVPFDIRAFKLRGLVPLPLMSVFPELNVRTYVVAEGRPGVWFFSLDAASALAVSGARAVYHLPYFSADMSARTQGETMIYSSRRTHRHAPPAEFQASYHPVGPVYRSQPGALDYWLTERYCLYATDGGGQLYRGDIHHQPWPLQPAEAEIVMNTMALAHGIQLPDTAPLLHYARRLDVALWLVHRV
jgi:uncharacterized protein YqjF (DUF2071 family)